LRGFASSRITPKTECPSPIIGYHNERDFALYTVG
jgi:hypothetical protein